MLNKNDSIKIIFDSYFWGIGDILTAINYGNENNSDWYIECDIWDGTIKKGYTYIKEKIDDVKIIKL